MFRKGLPMLLPKITSTAKRNVACFRFLFLLQFSISMSCLNNQFCRTSCYDGFGNLLRIPPSFYSFITMQCSILVRSFFSNEQRCSSILVSYNKFDDAYV